jgi:hypothetical protein
MDGWQKREKQDGSEKNGTQDAGGSMDYGFTMK